MSPEHLLLFGSSSSPVGTNYNSSLSSAASAPQPFLLRQEHGGRFFHLLQRLLRLFLESGPISFMSCWTVKAKNEKSR